MLEDSRDKVGSRDLRLKDNDRVRSLPSWSIWLPRSGCVSAFAFGVGGFVISCSQPEPSISVRPNLTVPSAEYVQNTMRYASCASQLYCFCRISTAQPPVSVPTAVPRVPSRIYHANTLLLSAAGTRCEIVDSSIALNGPISLPLNPFSDSLDFGRDDNVPWADHSKYRCSNEQPVITACSEHDATDCHK